MSGIYFLNCHIPDIRQVYARYVLGIYLVIVYQYIGDRSCAGPAVMFPVLVTGPAVHIGIYW